MAEHTPETLEQTKKRLDALLPERDAAVFAINANMLRTEWEKAFEQAFVTAENAIQGWEASERRAEAAKRMAAEEAWRAEVVEPSMVSLTIGPGCGHANKQEWLDDWMASWQDEVERLAATLPEEGRDGTSR